MNSIVTEDPMGRSINRLMISGAFLVVLGVGGLTAAARNGSVSSDDAANNPIPANVPYAFSPLISGSALNLGDHFDCWRALSSALSRSRSIRPPGE